MPAHAQSGGSGAQDEGFGGFSGGVEPQRSARTPEAIADSSYRAGLKHKEKAWKHEEKAARATDPKKRDRALADARKYYEKAIKAQAHALTNNEKHYEAANEMGYALRKTGDYRKAIGAYNYALQIRADFYPAIEYRGEALLMMGFVEESKEAYMTLFRNDRALAGQLLAAMEKWLSEQPEGDARTAFSDWLAQRKQLATIGNDLSVNNTRTW